MATTQTARIPEAPVETPKSSLLPYLFLGVVFGFALSKAEVLSWFRIQEMFRFLSFRMYGIIGSALVTAAISVLFIKRLGLRDLSGEKINIPLKERGSCVRYAVGGVCFGIGWALTGACPGALFALAGSGVSVMIVAIASALAGTWVYGLLRPRLPH